MKQLTVQEIERTAEIAESYYRDGKFFCSEAVVKGVLDALEVEYDPKAIAMASGFPVGIGGAQCLCGAVSGAVMAMGYLYGRTEPGDPRVKEAMARSREVHQRFVNRNKVTCCKVLTRGMVKGTPEHMAQCVRFVGEVTKDTLEIALGK